MSVDEKKLFAVFRWASMDTAYQVIADDAAGTVGISVLAAARPLKEWQSSATKAATFALEASHVADTKGLAKGELVLASVILLLGTLGQVHHDCGRSRQQVLSVLDLLQVLSGKGVSFAPDAAKAMAAAEAFANGNVSVNVVDYHSMPPEVQAALSKLGINPVRMPVGGIGGGGNGSGSRGPLN